MDLLAKKRVLFVLIFAAGLFPSCAWGDLFGLDRINYFSMKASGKQDVAFTVSLWTERGYSPPSVVEEFLDDPTEEKARKYLAWQRARLERIAMAQGVLERIRE